MVLLSHTNDALVIRARVANYEVQKVFVDSKSSVNVIFQETFGQMDIQQYKLEPIEIALFRFAGHIVYPREKIIYVAFNSGFRSAKNDYDLFYRGRSSIFIKYHLGKAGYECAPCCCINLSSKNQVLGGESSRRGPRTIFPEVLC